MRLSFILDLKPSAICSPSVGPDEPIQAAIDLLCRHDTGALLVLTPGTRHLVGMLSDRDILKSMCSDAPCDLATLKVRDTMRHEVLTASPDQEAHRALAMMTEHHVYYLPVVQGDEAVGMLSQRDILLELQQASEARIHSLSDYLGGCYGSKVY